MDGPTFENPDNPIRKRYNEIIDPNKKDDPGYKNPHLTVLGYLIKQFNKKQFGPAEYPEEVAKTVFEINQNPLITPENVLPSAIWVFDHWQNEKHRTEYQIAHARMVEKILAKNPKEDIPIYDTVNPWIKMLEFLNERYQEIPPTDFAPKI